MDEDQQTGVSRRSLVKGGVCALASIAIASLSGTKISAAETKRAKSTVQYVDVGKEEGKDCDDCIQFIPGKSATSPGTCKIVAGENKTPGNSYRSHPHPQKKDR